MRWRGPSTGRRRRLHYDRILKDGAVYSQPFSEGGAAAAGTVAFGTTAKRVQGGFVVNGKKIFASLAGHADFYGILAPSSRTGKKPSRRDTLYLAVPATRLGRDGGGRVGSARDARHRLRATWSSATSFVPEEAALMPPGLYFQAATRWPHMFLTLTPTYMGLAQAAYDFTVAYLRGESPGTPPVKRRMYPTKQIAVAQMRVMLEQTSALWFQAITEAGPDPTQGPDAPRAWPAQHTVMENANAIADARHAHLRRPVHAEIPAAGAHLARQPLRLADAALDRGAVPGPHRARGAVRAGRDGRMSGLCPAPGARLVCERAAADLDDGIARCAAGLAARGVGRGGPGGASWGRTTRRRSCCCSPARGWARCRCR